MTLTELKTPLADHDFQVALGTYGSSAHGAGARVRKTAHATEQDGADILKRRKE